MMFKIRINTSPIHTASRGGCPRTSATALLVLSLLAIPVFAGMAVAAPLQERNTAEQERRGEAREARSTAAGVGRATQEALRESSRTLRESQMLLKERLLDLGGPLMLSRGQLLELQGLPQVVTAEQLAELALVQSVGEGAAVAGSEDTDPAAALYREARQLASKSDWVKAEAMFADVIRQYAESRYFDDASYYRALALKKLGRYDESLGAIDRFLADQAKSRWVKDVKALKIEVLQALGRPVDPALLIESECELKMLALQSICSGNKERCIQLVQDILRSNSTECSELRRAALMFVGSTRSDTAIDLLIDVARNGRNIEERRHALLALGETRTKGVHDDRVFNLLRDVARNQNDAELARFALYALAEERSARVDQVLIDVARSAGNKEAQRHAIMMLGDRRENVPVDALVEIFRSNQDRDIRRFVLFALLENKDPRMADRVLELVKETQDPELRRVVMFHMAEKYPEKMVPLLINWYDAEQNEATKAHYIAALGNINNEAALDKLISIAKSDPIMDLRKRAIVWIGQSRHPKAIQFLESLLQ